MIRLNYKKIKSNILIQNDLKPIIDYSEISGFVSFLEI